MTQSFAESVAKESSMAPMSKEDLTRLKKLEDWDKIRALGEMEFIKGAHWSRAITLLKEFHEQLDIITYSIGKIKGWVS